MRGFLFSDAGPSYLPFFATFRFLAFGPAEILRGWWGLVRLRLERQQRQPLPVDFSRRLDGTDRLDTEYAGKLDSG